ncbi:MAG: FtsX-like permease family protein [SAR202 cluster bacterium]|nr:FtsX-like permease family protein [SAR202 cluster bacterium]|tara:strand:- start:43661 stop:47134 length:3474 start_codon:yes stop_codon:yes gene_type:complete
MEELFGLSMDIIMYVLLAAFLPVIAGVAIMAWRNRVMLKLGLRNIPRRKSQTALIVVGIMISTLIMAAAFGTGDSITFSIRKNAIDALGTIDEIIVSARADESDTIGSSNYFPLQRYEQLKVELADFEKIDGLAPGIGEFAPTINNRTQLSEGQMQITGVDPNSLEGFGRFNLTSGQEIRLENLGAKDAFINQEAADELDAVVGDELVTFVAGSSVAFTVQGVVDSGGLAGQGSTLLVRLDRAQEMFGRDGMINSMAVSNLGGVFAGAEVSDDVTDSLRVLFADRAIATQLQTLLNRMEVLKQIELLRPTLGEELASDLSLLAEGLGELSMTDDFIGALADEDVQEEALNALNNAGLTEVESQASTLFAGLAEFRVLDVKKQVLDQADQAGSGVTSIFIIMGLFSIMVGVLLIFLIFVMLAAARRAEMGMARAVGAKRRHLVQMFIFEGTAYSVVSGAVGVLLGLGASSIIVFMVNRIFQSGGSGAPDNFTMFAHFELRSAIVAYCLGMVITLATVGISAYRVSRLNIVAAVRGLPPPIQTSETPFRTRLLAPLRAFSTPVSLGGSALWALARLDISRGIGLLLRAVWAGLTSPLALFGAVFQALWVPMSHGWLTVVVGALLTWLGTTSDEAAPLRIGVTLVIIGVGLSIRTLVHRTGLQADIGDRIAYTFMGVVNLAFWVIPFRALRSIFGEIDGGIEMFFISGIAMVAAAVWTVMYNADLLLKVLTFVTGPFGQLRPVLVTAVAYPMSAKFRTGLTLAMFALVIFTLIVMSILTEAFSAAVGDSGRVAGGWDIQATVNFNTPIEDIRLAIDEKPSLNNVDIPSIGGYTTIPVETRQVGADEQRWQFYAVRAADDQFLREAGANLKMFDTEYGDTQKDIWNAVRADSNLVVVDSLVVPSRQGFANDELPFELEGIFYEDTEMEAIDIEVREPRTGQVIPLKVIGVLDRLTDAFGELGIGMLASREELDEAIPFRIPTTTYRFKAAEGVDVAQLSKDLESAFRENGMESDVLSELVDDIAAANRAFNYLFTSFMGLGLLVGIASLGVVSLRAVVERRQQIGVLRAIGYRRRMVQLSFLTESSFVVLMGTAIGVGLGTIISWNIVKDIQEEVETVRFAIPWIQIGIIVAIAYVFSLATTFLPARQASRIYPAEALRYE